MTNAAYDISQGFLVVTNYNQIGEVKDFLSRCRSYFSINQTIIVDDCSTDGSGDYAESHGFTVIRHDRNLGTGAAIRSGIKYAKERGAKWVILSSSNGKIRPEDYESIYTPILTGEADYVTGSRFMNGGESPGLSVFRKLAIPTYSLLAFPLLGRWFSDITCGFRAYTIDFVFDSRLNIEQAWLNRYDFEYYVHYWACKLGLRIKEVPVTIPYTHLSIGRMSKIRPIIDWWSMVRPLIYLSLGIRS